MANLVEEKTTLQSHQKFTLDVGSSEASSLKTGNEPPNDNSQIQSDATPSEIERLRGAKLYSVLGALVLVTLMFSLDTLVLATAIPKITDDFHTVIDIGWYATSYMLCSSALQPLTGKVYTYFDLTHSYLAFILLFEVGSIVCASAPTSTALVIGRALAGLGGSGLINGSMTIIGVAAPPEQRPVLMGIIMAMMGLGQIIAPLIGGALSQHASWRWCFWINLPCGAAAAVALFFLKVPNPNVRKGLTVRSFVRRFDLVGFCIFAPACIMILLALQWGGNQYAWKSPTIIGLICGSVVAFALFIGWEARHGDDAMFPSSLITQRVVYSSCLTAAFIFGSMLVVGYYLPLWFQAIKRTSPTMSAVSTLPVFVLQIAGVIVSSIAVSKIGFFTPFAVSGTALTALGTGLMSTFTPETGIGHWLGFQILVGIGRGCAFQQPVNAIQAGLSGAQMSTGMAIVAWAQFFGGALFVGVAQTSFTNLLRNAVHDFVPSINPEMVVNAGATDYLSAVPAGPMREALLAAYNQAITQTFYVSAAGAAIGTFTALGMGWKRVLKAKTQTSSKEGAADAGVQA